MIHFLHYSFNDLDELRQAGLSLADMNGHGLSKEMLLQGWQHLSRLELLFEKAESRSLSLEKSCRLLDQWKKRGDQLLYSMIPKGIADHLRAGKDPMGACQVKTNKHLISHLRKHRKILFWGLFQSYEIAMTRSKFAEKVLRFATKTLRVTTCYKFDTETSRQTTYES